MHKPLLDRRVRRQRIAVVVRPKKRRLRRVNVVALIKLAFQVWQSNHESEVLPDVSLAQLQGLSHNTCSAELGTRNLSTFDAKHSLALETIEVFGEAAAMCDQKMALNKERENGINLIERVEYP